jgi:hypothetical protein
LFHLCSRRPLLEPDEETFKGISCSLGDNFYIAITLIAGESMETEVLSLSYDEIAKADTLNESDYYCIEFFFFCALVALTHAFHDSIDSPLSIAPFCRVVMVHA